MSYETSEARRLLMLERRKGAYKIMLAAIKVGALPEAKTQRCVDCGERAEGWDHRDYSKPLDVQAVCGRCNTRRGPGAPYDALYAGHELNRIRSTERAANIQLGNIPFVPRKRAAYRFKLTPEQRKTLLAELA